MSTHAGSSALSDAQIASFIAQGFVRLDNVFPASTAEAARAILWRATGCDPRNPATWTRPVIRLSMYTQQPFVEAANTPVLHAAFDQLVGAGRWLPCGAIGTFPVRFPSAQDPGDAGWHIDASFGYEHPDFMQWRTNVQSRGRALLMLFLFSDVGEHDAPTRILGAHAAIARTLAGDRGRGPISALLAKERADLGMRLLLMRVNAEYALVCGRGSRVEPGMTDVRVCVHSRSTTHRHPCL